MPGGPLPIRSHSASDSMDVAARLFQSAPLWLVSQHWFVAPPSSAVNQPPVVQSAPHTSAEMFQLYKERQLKGSILVAGLTPDALVTFQPSCFRMLAMLMERTRAGQPYEAVTAAGAPPGWCPPLVAPTPYVADPTANQLPVIGPGGDLGSAERNAAVQLFSSTPHWFYFYSHDKAAARRSLPRSGSQMLQMYLQGVLADFVPVVGLDYFTHQTLPLCLFVPLGALLQLHAAGKTYCAVNAEDVRAFDRYNVSDAYASVNDARRPGPPPGTSPPVMPGSMGTVSPFSTGATLAGIQDVGSTGSGRASCARCDSVDLSGADGSRWQTAVFRLFTADSTRGNDEIVWWCCEPGANPTATSTLSVSTAADLPPPGLGIARRSSTGSSVSSHGSHGSAAAVPAGGNGMGSVSSVTSTALEVLMGVNGADSTTVAPTVPATGGSGPSGRPEPTAASDFIEPMPSGPTPAAVAAAMAAVTAANGTTTSTIASSQEEAGPTLTGPLGCEHMILAYAGGTITDGHLVCCTTTAVSRRGLTPPRHCFARLGALLAEAGQGVRRAPLTPSDVQRLAGGLASAVAAAGSSTSDETNLINASNATPVSPSVADVADALGVSRHMLLRAESSSSAAGNGTSVTVVTALPSPPPVVSTNSGRGTGVFAPQLHSFDRRSSAGPPPPPPARLPRSSDSAAMPHSMPHNARRSSWGTPDTSDIHHGQGWAPYSAVLSTNHSNGANFGGMLGGALLGSQPLSAPAGSVGLGGSAFPSSNSAAAAVAALSRQQLAAAAAAYGLDTSSTQGGYNNQDVMNMLSGLMVSPNNQQQQSGGGGGGGPNSGGSSGGAHLHLSPAARQQAQIQQHQAQIQQLQQQQAMLLSHGAPNLVAHAGSGNLGQQLTSGGSLISPTDAARKVAGNTGGSMWGEAELRALLAASAGGQAPLGMSQQQQQQALQQQVQQVQQHQQQDNQQQGSHQLIGEALAMLRYLQQGRNDVAISTDQAC